MHALTHFDRNALIKAGVAIDRDDAALFVEWITVPATGDTKGYFVMERHGRRHILPVDFTDTTRLNMHWDAFCRKDER